MSSSVLIFCQHHTPRMRYMADFLSLYYGLRFELSSDETRFGNESGGVINYSSERIRQDEIYLTPHSLLGETGIKKVEIECFEQNGHPCFFKSKGDMGFDLFAAIFYLVSRYEEYVSPEKKDEYGRFAHTASLAFQNNFLHLPLVNTWLEIFRKLLQSKDIPVSSRSFSFLPSYDIDMAWSYRNKGWKRNAGAILRSLSHLKFSDIVHRLKVLQEKEDDPFDAYEWMDHLHHVNSLKPLYFFLVATERNGYDKNIDPEHPRYGELVKKITHEYAVGLHPSWASGDRPGFISSEKKLLEQLAGKEINSSRQHFIRFTLLQTYRQLLSAGITDDYSMGYGSINGFRASITTPFYWYDLAAEQSTPLLLHPFCFMDANAFYEQKLFATQAAKELRNYLQAVGSVRGEMITIWHNSFLGTDPQFEGWKEVYADFVKEAKSIS